MEKLLSRLPARPQPIIVRYAATTVIMAVSVALQLAIARYTHLPGLFILLIGIFLAAVLFDRGSGFYATFLATASAYVTIRELIDAVPNIPALVVFFGVGMALAFFSEALRKALERAVKAEREMDILFHELSHRMQNNLTMAVSLLDMQARSHPNPEVKLALANAGDRLNILSEGQRHLQLVGAGMVEMQGYLGRVCEHLSRSVGAARAIDFTFKVEPVSLPADRALVMGLITNELVTNAIKYAFLEGKKGTITVSFSHKASGELELIVDDDGAGCPDDAADGFGSKLIHGLTAQHGGKCLRQKGNPGCCVQVTIPPPNTGLRF